MAIAKKNNILSGLIGSVIFYDLKGKQAARIKPRTIKQSKSAQMAQCRSNFGIIQRLMQQFHDYIIPGFSYVAKERSVYREAMSVNLANYYQALKEENSEGLHWVEVSKGRLSGAKTINAQITDDFKLILTWQGTQSNLNWSNSDNVMILVTAGFQDYTYIKLKATTRDKNEFTLNLVKGLRNIPLHCFISFSKKTTGLKPGNISTSQYILAELP